jgi:hypothetical protein
MIHGRMGLAADVTPLIVPPFFIGGIAMSTGNKSIEGTTKAIGTRPLLRGFQSKVLVVKSRWRCHGKASYTKQTERIQFGSYKEV